MEWLKDLLGINRYVIRYDFPSVYAPGRRNTGVWGPYHKFKCISRADISRRYYVGTYTVEPFSKDTQ